MEGCDKTPLLPKHTTLVGYRRLFQILSGTWRPLPEILICEKYSRDARDRLADRLALLPLRGPGGGPWRARGGDRNRAWARCDRRVDQPVEQPLLQRAAGQELGHLRVGVRRLHRAGELLRRPVGVPALFEPVVADPLAQLDDHALSR